MKINKNLLKVKVNYFLNMGGNAAVIPFLPVYAISNLGFSYKALGFVYTLLPFTTIFTKTLSGFLSDLFHCHRPVFISSLVLPALLYLSFIFLQPIPLEASNATAKVNFECSEYSYLKFDLPFETCSNRKYLNNTDVCNCETICNTSLETIEYLYKSWNMILSKSPKMHLQFSSSVDLRDFDQENNVTMVRINNLSLGNFEVTHPYCSQMVQLNCSTKCDNEALMDYLGAPLYIAAPSYSGFMSHYQFWLFLGLFITANSGFTVSVLMSDTICFQMLGTEETHNYGKQRLWGSMGWGMTSIITGFLIDATSSSLHKNYLAMFILAFFILTVNLFLASRLKINPRENLKIDWNLVLKVLSNRRILIFLLCIIIMGITSGIIWAYLLVLAEFVAYKWDCNFEHMKLLQGLIIGVQCFGGEIPFFFISGAIIKILGYVHSMSLVIFIFGVRFILYSFVTNPWMFLPLEVLNGFTFGVFYSVLTSYAKTVAPPGAEATLQGIFGAAFLGIGLAIGAFLGAALFNVVSESHAFFYIGIFNVVFAICHIIIQIILNIFDHRSGNFGEKSCVEYSVQEEHTPIPTTN